MGIEDIPRIGKAIKAAKAAKALENADDVIHPILILEREGVEYEFHNMSFRQAEQIWFSKIERAQIQGTEEKIDLPSELPKERQEALEAEANPPKAEIIPFPVPEKKPAKLEPGIYLDEDSGKYYKITKDGDLEELDK